VGACPRQASGPLSSSWTTSRCCGLSSPNFLPARGSRCSPRRTGRRRWPSVGRRRVGSIWPCWTCACRAWTARRRWPPSAPRTRACAAASWGPRRGRRAGSVTHPGSGRGLRQAVPVRNPGRYAAGVAEGVVSRRRMARPGSRSASWAR
jgi:hypothetical protein